MNRQRWRWMGGLCLAASLSAQGGLVAWYQAEGNAADAAGAYDGTLVNGAGYGSGRLGQAFQLNGTSQYVTVPDSPAWAFGTNAFSLAVCVRFSAIRKGSVTALPNVFVAQDEGGGIRDKWVFFHDGTSKLAFHVNGNGSSFLEAPTAFTPVVGVWTLFALTRSGSTYSFYANTNFLGTATRTSSIPDAAAVLTIGQAEGLGYVAGRLDEVRIYDHALSAAEIAALHASLDSPRIEGVSLDATQVALRWTAVSSATGYCVRASAALDAPAPAWSYAAAAWTNSAWTGARSAADTQRFYRVEALLP